MKNSVSIIVFAALIASSAIGSIGSYRATEQAVVENLNNALHQVIAANKATWLTQDTIANYRRMQGTMAAPLAINMRDHTLCRYMSEPLRDKTFVEMKLVGQGYAAERTANGYLCSDTILWTDEQQNASLAVRSVALCSKATIFAMSDQRMPAALLLSAIVWAAVMWRRRKEIAVPQAGVAMALPASEAMRTRTIGGITFRDDAFFDSHEQEIHLTPMQRRLLTMFFDSPDHKLRQSDICDSLWPRKDDASETLYALITRTKKAVENRCGIRIEVDRGRGYSLAAKQ